MVNKGAALLNIEEPEEAIRMALEHLLTSLALAVKRSGDAKYWFPMMFPMEMTLESEQLRWNFRLVARLKNEFFSEAEK